VIAKPSGKMGENEMFIVDAQIHIWGADTPQRPWPSGRSRPQRPQPFSKDDLLNEMDAAGVAVGGDRAAVMGGRPQRSGAGGSTAASRSVRGYMGRPLAVARLPSDWRDQRGVLGLRVTSNTAEARALFDDPTGWVWNEAEQAGLPIMVSPSGLLAKVDRIATYHPELELVIDHLGVTAGKGQRRV
jgi:L-fuconolactonase